MMRAERHNRFIKALGVLSIVLLALFLSPSEGRAVTGADICASLSTYGGEGGDYDNDGFTNVQECDGITFVGSSAASFPGYNARNGLNRTGYLDPAGEDLFFFLVRANNSLIPASTPEGIYSAGLGVTTHEITPSDADVNRYVTPTQKAVRITESLDTTGTIFGAAWQGSPNDLDGATVYTQRIANFVNGKCASATTCKDSSGAAVGAASVINLYIKNVIAHEAGHVTKLTPVYSSRYEWHYAAGSGTVMEQSAKFTSKGGTVTFYLSQHYTAADVAGVALK